MSNQDEYDDAVSENDVIEIETIQQEKHSIEISNQMIITLAYSCKDIIGVLEEHHTKLAFEEANCHLANFYFIRNLLELVPNDYKHIHDSLTRFFCSKKRILDIINDKLYFVDNPNQIARLIRRKRKNNKIKFIQKN
jgi:hypothetical protein